MIILVIATKALTGRGTPLRGGLPSGHAAIAFAGVDGGDVSRSARASTASSSRRSCSPWRVLVAQTRIETGIHSTLEVVYGGALGAGVTLVVFQLFF